MGGLACKGDLWDSPCQLPFLPYPPVRRVWNLDFKLFLAGFVSFALVLFWVSIWARHTKQEQLWLKPGGKLWTEGPGS